MDKPFDSVEIFRETVNNIDLLIVVDSIKFAVIIENKWNAKESDGQLEKYLLTVKSLYKGYRILPLFLTIKGENASHDQYGKIGYSLIEGCINDVISKKKESQQIKFINYYLQILNEKLTGVDYSETYHEFQDELDEILSYTSSNIFNQLKDTYPKAFNKLAKSNREARSLKSYFDQFIEEHDVQKLRENERLENRFWFIMLEIKEIANNINKGYDIACWFKRKGNRLSLNFEIGNFDNQELKEEFYNSLAKSGAKIKASTLKAKSSKVLVYSLTLDDWLNAELVHEAINTLYKKMKSDNEAINLIKHFHAGNKTKI